MTMLTDTSYPHVYDSPTTCYMKSITDHHPYAGDHHARPSRIHGKTSGLVTGKEKKYNNLDIFPESITSTEMKEGRRFTTKKKLKAKGNKKK